MVKLSMNIYSYRNISLKDELVISVHDLLILSAKSITIFYLDYPWYN